MVWKCIHGVSPVYLSDLCISATATSGRRALCSASSQTLIVLRVRTAVGPRRAQRSFAVNGPTKWNSLPPPLWAPELSQNAFMCAEDAPVLDRPASPLRRFYPITSPNANVLTDWPTYCIVHGYASIWTNTGRGRDLE